MRILPYDSDQGFGDVTDVPILITGSLNTTFALGDALSVQSYLQQELTSDGWRFAAPLIVNVDGSLTALVLGSASDNLSTVARVFGQDVIATAAYGVSNVQASFGGGSTVTPTQTQSPASTPAAGTNALNNDLLAAEAWIKKNGVYLALGGGLLFALMMRRR